MLRPAHPQRVYDLADRLAIYFEDEPIVVAVKLYNRQGNYITVSLKGNEAVGLVFHADQLDNGASGFKDEALMKIRAYIAGQAYEAPPKKQQFDYSDVMTLSATDPVPGEVSLE